MVQPKDANSMVWYRKKFWPQYSHSPTRPVFDGGRGSPKWPGPGFSYHSSKAGAIEVQKRNTGLEGQVIPQIKALVE